MVEDFEREFQYAYESASGILLKLEDPVYTSKSFKEDKCVICLSKEPQVLFVECRHYCVCLECEKNKPLSNCPKCRKRIETKVTIKIISIKYSFAINLSLNIYNIFKK